MLVIGVSLKHARKRPQGENRRPQATARAHKVKSDARKRPQGVLFFLVEYAHKMCRQGRKEFNATGVRPGHT